jgi:hypothetical protein
MSESFLDNNLSLSYPFADNTSSPVTGVVADAMIAGDQAGPYVLEVFTPNYDFLLADPLANAAVRISGPDGVFIDTAAAVSTDLGGGFRSMEVARFVVSTAAASSLGTLLGDVEFSAAVTHRVVEGVDSIQGLTGEVELVFDDFSTITQDDDGVVNLTFDDPIDRVDCSGIDCDRVYGIGGQAADGNGSLHIDATECYRLTPHPTILNRLVLRNVCSPCLDCDDVLTVQGKIVDQAEYYHQLAAIHHNQFNRYQRSVAGANAYIADSQTRADISIADQGTISLVDRVFNRPYFTQLYLALVNNTTYRINVDLTVTITPADVSAQLTPQSESFLVQRTLIGGDPLDSFAGFPGSYAFDVDPQDTVGLNSESKRTTINDASTTGQWNVTATVTFLSGPSPLPSPQVINRVLTPNISLFGASLTS